MKLSELLKTLEINEHNYTQGGWGNAMGSHIKYPASYVKRWTREVPDPLNPGSTKRIFDTTSAFNELALNCIVAIRANPKYRVIKDIDRYWEFLPKDLTEYIQSAIYQLMNHIILNRDIWQKVNTSSVSLPNWSATVDSTSWILSGNMLSKYVENVLRGSEMSQYELIQEGNFEAYKKYTDNNLQVILKTSDIDNITEERIMAICVKHKVSKKNALKIARQIIEEAI